MRKWFGRCPACSEFGSVVEELQREPERATARGRGHFSNQDASPTPIADIEVSGEVRLSTHSVEMDRVLGGGLVPGSLVLLGGDPGIGKSTLVLGACQRLSRKASVCLYVTAEESLAQIKLRADRLSVDADNLLVMAETQLEQVLDQVAKIKPNVMVIDSIQTVYSAKLDSAPGSVAQVREVTAQLMYLAKGQGIATFVIGHVTKEGSIAGPRVLEHMVDTVLYFEGAKTSNYRILRAHKNRFGSTNEIAVFEMQSKGLVDVTNPSAHLLAERPEDAPGSVVVPTMEGSRPMLVEVQGLVVGSPFGTPRRTALGIDPNRVALLSAIAERAVGADFIGQDIFLNVAGGVRLNDPATDLGVAVALISSLQRRPVTTGFVLLGELGLSGELRSVVQAEARLNEAAKLGFTDAVLPAKQARALRAPKALRLHAADNLEQACASALGERQSRHNKASVIKD